MQFVNDTFTDTDSTLLENHAGELGAVWTKFTDGVGTAIIQGGRVILTGSQTVDEFYASGVPSSNEYDVECDLIVTNSAGNNAAGIMGRVDPTGTNDFYLVDYTLTTHEFRLLKRVGGAFTVLGTYSVVLVQDNVYPIKLEIRNSAKKLFVQNIERISTPDNSITVVGRPGLRQSSLSIALDNFSATNGIDSTSRFLSASGFQTWNPF